MSTKSKVAVIGPGNIGKIDASNIVKGNREVIIASHKIEDAKALAAELGKLAKATDVKSAVNEADVVILSVWFSTVQELFKQYPTEFNGKIVIDPSNPIAPDGNGGFKKIIWRGRISRTNSQKSSAFGCKTSQSITAKLKN